MKVSVGNDTYNLTKYNKIQLLDVSEIKFPNTGSDLLLKWNIICINKHNDSRLKDFIKSTRTNSPTPNTGSTLSPPMGNSFMYIETSRNNHGYNNVFVSLERTDIIQITNITFYHNRFSIDGDYKAMGRFRIQLLLEDNTWSTRNTLAKITQYTNTPTEWTLLNLDFTIKKFGFKLIYDQIESPLCDMCFSNITITHSVY